MVFGGMGVLDSCMVLPVFVSRDSMTLNCKSGDFTFLAKPLG